MPIVARIRKAMRRPASVTAQPDMPPQSVDPLVPEALPSWEEQFTRWIAEARAVGADPNDIGDRDVGDGPGSITRCMPITSPQPEAPASSSSGRAQAD